MDMKMRLEVAARIGTGLLATCIAGFAIGIAGRTPDPPLVVFCAGIAAAGGFMWWMTGVRQAGWVNKTNKWLKFSATSNHKKAVLLSLCVTIVLGLVYTMTHEPDYLTIQWEEGHDVLLSEKGEGRNMFIQEVVNGAAVFRDIPPGVYYVATREIGTKVWTLQEELTW
jgi:hypothetical protein